MSKPLRIIFIARVLVAVLASTVLHSSQAALALNPAEAFFTDLADRLLQQQLGLRLDQVQIAPMNQYDSAVHRLFQVTANIYDATTTNEFPAVFRPLFDVTSNGVFLAGFTNDASVSTLTAWLESNPYGVPVVIAARTGIPSFNEFTVRSGITVQRNLQVVRTNPAPGSLIIATNQMYVLGVSNHVAVESWNSYSRGYPRAVTLSSSNSMTLAMANAQGVQTNATLIQAAVTNLASDAWLGFAVFTPTQTHSFVASLSTNQVFLSNAVYRAGNNMFANVDTNNFESTPGFPLPDAELTISNRLFYVMSEGDRILDCVLLHGVQAIDLQRALIAAPASGGPRFLRAVLP